MWTRYWLALLSGLAGYVLSTGPVVSLYVQTQNPALRQAAALVYLPLGLFDDTPVSAALGAWIRWCCEHAPSCC